MNSAAVTVFFGTIPFIHCLIEVVLRPSEACSFIEKYLIA